MHAKNQGTHLNFFENQYTYYLSYDLIMAWLISRHCTDLLTSEPLFFSFQYVPLYNKCCLTSFTLVILPECIGNQNVQTLGVKNCIRGKIPEQVSFKELLQLWETQWIPLTWNYEGWDEKRLFLGFRLAWRKTRPRQVLCGILWAWSSELHGSVTGE